MKKHKKYDVYKCEELVYEGLTAEEIENMLGIKQNTVRDYTSRGNIYQKQWEFTTHGVDLATRNDFRYEDSIKWDEIREAFRLLKSGIGDIVCVNGVKFTKRMMV